jgi:hypothetical protein
VTTPTGLRWSLTNSPNLTPPGYYYLVAVDARDVPSEAKIIKVTQRQHARVAPRWPCDAARRVPQSRAYGQRSRSASGCQEPFEE